MTASTNHFPSFTEAWVEELETQSRYLDVTGNQAVLGRRELVRRMTPKFTGLGHIWLQALARSLGATKVGASRKATIEIIVNQYGDTKEAEV